MYSHAIYYLLELGFAPVALRILFFVEDVSCEGFIRPALDEEPTLVADWAFG